ncbi:MAG: recombinase family protein [Bacilli bacterium]
MKRRNIGYVRVSTSKQVKKGYSLGEQKEELLRHAESLNMILKEEDIYIDKGYSGTSLKRPMIQKVIKTIAHEEVNTLFIISSDRLTRSPKYKLSLKMVFEKFGTTIESINNDWSDGKSIDEEFKNDLKSLLDEMEVKKIRPRTIRGLTGSARQGNYTIGGSAPRGYIRIKKKEGEDIGSHLVPDEENKKYIINIFKSLSENRYSKLGIAKLYKKNKVMNKFWNEKTITTIVNNPLYYGRFVTGYCDIENHTTPLVSKELWLMCQDSLKHRNQRTKHFYIYNNLVYCPKCHTYCTQESSWKTSRDGKQKFLYLYYKCPECKMRINENDVTKKVIFTLDNKKLPENKLNALNVLYAKINKIKARLKYYEDDFDEGLMLGDEFKEKHRSGNIKITTLLEEIRKIEEVRETAFMKLSKMEKRDIVTKNIKRIDVDLNKDYKKVSKIVYNEEDEPQLFHKNVDNLTRT